MMDIDMTFNPIGTTKFSLVGRCPEQPDHRSFDYIKLFADDDPFYDPTLRFQAFALHQQMIIAIKVKTDHGGHG
jgi:hypothetical protein